MHTVVLVLNNTYVLYVCAWNYTSDIFVVIVVMCVCVKENRPHYRQFPKNFPKIRNEFS